jgi:fatty acid synthase subunit alpha
MSEMMITNSLVRIKDAPPYAPELEAPVLLNSMARASLDPKTNSYGFTAKFEQKPRVDTANVKAVSQILADNSVSGIGVDQGTWHGCIWSLHRWFTRTELISSVPSWNPTFVERNFTDAEIAYCNGQPSPPSSFAARWAGKEAVFKSLGVPSRGAGAAMKEIEILPGDSGAPRVILHGEAKSAAGAKGVKSVLVSLSHSDTVAIAFAQASST